MILNSAETKLISSQGWADKGSFCVVDTKDDSISKFNLENAEYTCVQKIENNCFLCSHHFRGEKLVLTTHSFEKPESIIGRIEIKNREADFNGDGHIWQNAPRFIVEWLKDDFSDDYYLLEIKPFENKVDFHLIEWFHADEYDRGYQGLYEVIEVPNTNFLLFPIQRSSRPVLYDFAEKKVVKKIKLAGRAGTPSFKFRKQKTELWTVDYDTLVKLEVGTWNILRSKKFQWPLFGYTMTWVGDFFFTPDEKFCVLARPYSKDVLLLDCENFKKVGEVKTKLQPLKAIALSNFKCIYRDWQTGEFEFKNFIRR